MQTPVQVIEHPGRGVEVAGAREVRVSTLEEAVAVLRDGAKHRITAATLMNQASSRSHSIFMLRLDQVSLFVFSYYSSILLIWFIVLTGKRSCNSRVLSS